MTWVAGYCLLLRSSFLKSLRRVFQTGCSDGMAQNQAPATT